MCATANESQHQVLLSPHSSQLFPCARTTSTASQPELVGCSWWLTWAASRCSVSFSALRAATAATAAVSATLSASRDPTCALSSCCRALRESLSWEHRPRQDAPRSLFHINRVHQVTARAGPHSQPSPGHFHNSPYPAEALLDVWISSPTHHPQTPTTCTRTRPALPHLPCPVSPALPHLPHPASPAPGL